MPKDFGSCLNFSTSASAVLTPAASFPPLLLLLDPPPLDEPPPAPLSSPLPQPVGAPIIAARARAPTTKRRAGARAAIISLFPLPSRRTVRKRLLQPNV